MWHIQPHLDSARRRVDDHRVRRRIRRKETYDGPFACKIALDGSGDAKEIDVSQGWVFAGTTGKSDFTGTFDDTTDIKGDAFTAAEYALVMAIDVDPDDGQFAGAYGPELFAVKNDNTDVEEVQSNTVNIWTPGAVDVDVPMAFKVLCLFDISGAGGTFSNLRQRFKWDDIYVPVHGYSGTETSKSDWTSYHPYDPAYDQNSDNGWFVCSWFINFDVMRIPFNTWMANHDHALSAGVTGTTDSHTHTYGNMTTVGAAGAPSWP